MQIRMKQIATAEDRDGTRYVFGPEGREYNTESDKVLTEDMARQLVKAKAATDLKKGTQEVSEDGNE